MKGVLMLLAAVLIGAIFATKIKSVLTFLPSM
jgi:hypothetical protein